MEEINHMEEDLTHTGEDSQVYEPLATLEASTPQPDDAEPTTDELDPLPDVQDEDIERSHWRATVAAYVATQTEPLMADDVLEHGFHFTPGGWTRSEQM